MDAKEFEAICLAAAVMFRAGEYEAADHAVSALHREVFARREGLRLGK